MASRTRSARSGAYPICKVCGSRDKFDFKVSDNLWTRIVPRKYRNQIVCLECFDELAFKKNIDYSDAIAKLYFAGNQAVFEFETVAANTA